MALARALAPRPRLVLLDEPFASLDQAGADQLRHSLRQILQTLGVPAILVTHDPQEALALGDRMLLMNEGRILRDGAPAEVLSATGDAARAQIGEVFRARVVGRDEGLLRLEVGPSQLFTPDPGGEFREAYACIRGKGYPWSGGPMGTCPSATAWPPPWPASSLWGPCSTCGWTRGSPWRPSSPPGPARTCGWRPGQAVHALIKATAIQVIPIES